MVTSTIACSSSGGSSDSGGATAAGVLTVTPASQNLNPGQQVTISPTGGTAPYIFTLQGTDGTLSSMSGSSTVFTAGSQGGIVYVLVQDSSNPAQQTQVSFTIAGLVVTPLTTTAAPSGTVSYMVSGGTAPYSYIASAGTFSGATLTIPASATNGQVITVTIGDSAGHSIQATVTVSTSGGGGGTTSGSCAGTYTLNLDGYPGTMQLIEDANGNIGGYLQLTGYGYAAYIGGTCISGTISFTDSYSQSPYTGQYFTNPNTGKTVMTGSFSDSSGSYPWFATQQ